MAKASGVGRKWRDQERGIGGSAILEGGGADAIATFTYDTENPEFDRDVLAAEQRAQELALSTGVEHAVVLAADGRGYLTRGDEGSVGLAGGAFGLQNARMITHTHPPGKAGGSRATAFEGKGGSFSGQDMRATTAINARTMKAVGPEGTYIMSRPRRGWPKFSMDKHYAQVEAHRQRLIKQHPAKYKGKESGLAYIDAVHLAWASWARKAGGHYRFIPNPKWTGPTY